MKHGLILNGIDGIMNIISPNKYIVFIESNTTGTGRLFLKKTIEKGFQPIFITANPNKYNFLTKDLIIPVILNTSSYDELFNYLLNQKNIKGIFSTSEYFIETSSQLANAFHLPSNDYEAVSLCRDKYRLGQFLKKHSIHHPKSWQIENSLELSLMSSIPYPLVIKPNKGSGSVGVKLCMDHKQLLKQLQFQPFPSVLQEYIEGPEYSVETIGIGGKIHVVGVTKKYTGALPNFVEIGHDFPAQLDTKLYEAIKSLVVDCLTKLKLIFGPIHTEVKIKDGVPYVIEINPRLAGGMIPELIRLTTGLDLINLSLDLVVSNPSSRLRPSKQRCWGAIRFILAPKNGCLCSVELKESIKNQLARFVINKNPGDKIALKGDFNDRIGFLMAFNKNAQDCWDIAELAIKNTKVDVKENTIAEDSIADTGRIKEILMPEVQTILNQTISLKQSDEFDIMTDIDIAHLFMLHQTDNIDEETLIALIKEIMQLRDSVYSSLLSRPMPRGQYLHFESELIKRLGVKVAGVLHMGRSRNDINATIFYLNMKNRFFKVYEALWGLQSTLVNQSKLHIDTLLPLYSQYQIALPGTLGHYLLGLFNALSRDQEVLASLYTMLDRCPLGAGSCGGTTIKIDPTITADLLGFSKSTNNSLDAIASRDVALRFLSSLSIAATTLSRLTEDLQLWSTREFGFIDFPDKLAGGSSMMPQKKNPYLLEKIKSQLSTLSGELMASMMAMYKVPFGNSVEVGTGSVSGLDDAVDNFTKPVKLLQIIISNISFNVNSIRDNTRNNVAYATYIAEMLVKKKLYNTKEAHYLIGDIIRDAMDKNHDLNEALQPVLDLLKIRALDPLKVAHEMEYGAGPGRTTTEKQYFLAQKKLEDNAFWLKMKKNIIDRANQMRENFIKDLLQKISCG